MRLDKYVALALDCTRKDAKGIIISKKIKIVKDDMEVVKYNVDYNVTTEKIYFNNELIVAHEFVYIMMNKPSGVLSATTDKYNKCALDLIDGYKTRNLGLIGRLDIDTEGLLIITDDGALIHKLTSPKGNHPKKYLVKVDKEFNIDDKNQISNGVYIDVDGEKYLTKPASLELIDKKTAYITITEGKFHQIKLMMKAIGKEVVYLKRLEINNLKLDDTLDLGMYRLLTDQEVEILKH